MQDSTRGEWLAVLERLARPVLSALAVQELRARMPLRHAADAAERASAVAHLEAVARLLCGIAPWLELSVEEGDSAEQELRREFLALARRGLVSAVDPDSKDALNFDEPRQVVVDSSFLALALLRAPNALWAGLDELSQRRLLDCLRRSRRQLPAYNNWLLFAAIIEAALLRFGADDWDAMRIDYALMQHEQWYVGDGSYGDGPEFHWDYYNSFVIQPMLLAILDVVGEREARWQKLVEPMHERARRYAAVQERLIAPDGSIPPIGRSLAYRFGALQLLGLMALRHDLPAEVEPAQVRCGMGAVITRSMAAPSSFDAEGWLEIGHVGKQPSIGESYINTGSCYLCAAGLLPLGLPADDRFWSDPPRPWTALRLWSGDDLPADHALRG